MVKLSIKVNGSVAANIRNARIFRELDQGVVAEMLGITSAALSQYEGGKRSPSIETVLQLSKIYHVSLDYLVGNESAQEVLGDVHILTSGCVLNMALYERLKKSFTHQRIANELGISELELSEIIWEVEEE